MAQSKSTSDTIQTIDSYNFVQPYSFGVLFPVIAFNVFNTAVK